MSASNGNSSQPSELVYLPDPSWLPLLVAAGIAGVIISLFTWFPYGVVGAIVAIGALLAWIKDSREGYGRLPRSQRITTAPIPAAPLMRPER